MLVYNGQVIPDIVSYSALEYDAQIWPPLRIIYDRRTKTFTGLPSGTEVRVVQGSYTLAHEQSVTSGSYDFVYDAVGDPVKVRFTNPGYWIYPIDFTRDLNDSTFPVTVIKDPSYI